jgi:2-(1,2-epoxy-1,2-dihydrophenyl)acetyl-CoA isomerase
MTDQDVVLYETSGAVATITLNRPKVVNAINGALLAALTAAIRRAEGDAAVRIVVIRGAGKGFSSGADLAGGVMEQARSMLENEFRAMLMAIHDGSKLYIAQVHGPAAGIGAALAMNCDFMVMAEGSTIYMAFAAISLIPDGGATQLLLQAMGYRRALEAMVEGKHTTAAECLAYGIANKVVPAADLEATVRAWAEKLAAGAPLAQASAKRVLRQVGLMTYNDVIMLEAKEQDALLHSEDCREGVAAFFAKRKPAFRGK